MTSRISALFLFLAIVGANAARADEATLRSARERFAEGTKHYDVGRYREAAAEYEAAYRISNEPLMLFNIGQAYRLAGDAERALGAYRGFLRRLPDAPQRGEVEAHIATLESDLQRQVSTAAAQPAASGGVADPGWSLAGGVVGLVGAVVTIAFGAAGEATRADANPSAPLGATATAFAIVGAGVAQGGAASTRRQTGVPGSLGLRVAGWICLGVGIAGFVVTAAYYGAKHLDPDGGLIGASSAVMALGPGLLGGDALLTHIQAKRRRVQVRAGLSTVALTF